MTPSPYSYPFYSCAQLPSAQGRSLFPKNVTQRQYPPTFFNSCLDREYHIWQDVQRCGGLMAICPGKKYDAPPWVRMPPGAKRFSPISSIPLPVANYGVDQLVLSFLVPYGFDGVINYIVQNYTGQGFQEGAGDLTWRWQLNERYVKNYGNTEVQIGSLTQGGVYVPNSQIIVQSGQLVQGFVNVAGSAAVDLNGGRIIMSAFGYYWPR